MNGDGGVEEMLNCGFKRCSWRWAVGGGEECKLARLGANVDNYLCDEANAAKTVPIMWAG